MIIFEWRSVFTRLFLLFLSWKQFWDLLHHKRHSFLLRNFNFFISLSDLTRLKINLFDLRWNFSKLHYFPSSSHHSFCIKGMLFFLSCIHIFLNAFILIVQSEIIDWLILAFLNFFHVNFCLLGYIQNVMIVLLNNSILLLTFFHDRVADRFREFLEFFLVVLKRHRVVLDHREVVSEFAPFICILRLHLY